MQLPEEPMFRRILVLIALSLCARTTPAQDLSSIQVHGFVTQGFLYSSNNNLFTMKTSEGSARWTDGAISFSDTLTDKLRIGIQLHVYQFGEFGGPNLQIDWATGDYSASEKIRFVAGKVKTVFGLYNDSQDVDTVHLWILLPESVYPTDNKSFLLAHYGGDFYGAVNAGKHLGKLSYRGYAGYRSLDLNGGYVKQISELAGMTFAIAPGGNVFGGDLRWQTPVKGLLVGGSAITSNLDGTSPQGSFHIPYATQPAAYAKYERGKLVAVGEYRRTKGQINLNVGGFIVPGKFDSESWYLMSSYRILEKLQAGAYYSHQINPLGDPSLPANFSKEWVISGRYDFNSFFYAKLEDHIINGTELSYYGSTNPSGLKPKSNLLAAKVGFSF
jgi:hypothetical protein